MITKQEKLWIKERLVRPIYEDGFFMLGTGFLMAAVLFFVYGTMTRVKHCSDFSNQQQAQDALVNNPRLDGNHDGIACNGYFK